MKPPIRRRGLTLVETLAALALLAVVAVACTRLLHPPPSPDPDAIPTISARQPAPGAAALLAAMLIHQPTDLGVPDLASLPQSPAALAPTVQAVDRLLALGINPHDARVWRTPIPTEESPIAVSASPSPTSDVPSRPRRPGPIPHWLFVQLGDDLAVRCVRLPSRRPE